MRGSRLILWLVVSDIFLVSVGVGAVASAHGDLGRLTPLLGAVVGVWFLASAVAILLARRPSRRPEAPVTVDPTAPVFNPVSVEVDPGQQPRDRR